MVYPYAVSDTFLLYGLGAAMCVGLWWLLGQTTLGPNAKVLVMLIGVILIFIIVYSGAGQLAPHLPK